MQPCDSALAVQDASLFFLRSFFAAALLTRMFGPTWCEFMLTLEQEDRQLFRADTSAFEQKLN